MKAKKVLLIILGVLIVLSPSIALVGCYLHSRTVRSEVIAATVKDDLGKTVECKKGDEFFELFKNTLGTKEDRPTALTALPEKALSYARYDVVYTDSFNIESAYTYYISESAADCYYVDGEKHPYRIAVGSARAFLDSPYAERVYSNSSAPAVTVNDTLLQPYTVDWNYVTAGGSERKASGGYTDRNVTNTLEGFLVTFAPDFALKPDSISVEVREKEGEVLYSGSYEGISALTIEGSKDVSVDMTAIWNKSEEKNYNGTAKYFFEGKMFGRAAFKLNTAAARCGEVLVLSAYNVIDTSDITVSCSPEITFPLKFYKVGQNWQALLPIAANAVTSRTTVSMTVSSPSATEVFLVEISPISAGVCSYYGPDQATLFSDTVLAAFRNTVDPIANGESSFSFTGGKFTVPAANNYAGASSSASYSFGSKVTLMSIGKSFTALDRMFCANANNLGKDAAGNTLYGEGKSTSALAAFDGKVVFSGSTTLTGRMVIIDHGSGLKSYYTNLSSDVAVKVGDNVAAGQFLAHAADGGLNSTLNFNFHVAVTVNGVAVNIDPLIEKGLIGER